MKLLRRHFAMSLTCAAAINALAVVMLIPSSEGVNSKAIGPQIDFDVTAGGVLGAAVEPTEVAEDTAREDPLPEEKQAEDVIEPEQEQTKQAKLDDNAVEVEAEFIESEEPVSEDVAKEKPLTAEPEPVPTPKPAKKAKPKKKKKAAESKYSRKAKTKKTIRKTGKSKRRAKSGSSSSGAAGRKRGGGGKARASRGAISSYKSRVQARMASCVSRRVAGRSPGRVTIRFGVSSGGGIRGVSVSGSSSIRGAAASAARGCSMPPPPSGAGSLRFAFPVTVR